MIRRFQAKHLILATVGVLIIAIIAISVASALMLREKEIETWRRQIANLTLVMEEETSQTMSSAKIAMDSIAERIDALGIRNEAELRTRTNTEAMHQIMRDKITGLTQVDVATIVAANGDVINFTRSFPAPAINLSDREYFVAQRETPALGLSISIPVHNKGNGKWVFYLGRRLIDSNGQFMGLVLIGISVDQFINFYERLGKNLGEGAAITLYRSDFAVLARWPNKDETIGEKNLTGTTHLVVAEMKKTEDVLYTSGPRFSDSGASVARLGAVRVLDRFPMMLNLTVTEEFFLANWRHAARWIASVAAGSTLALAAVMIVLLRIVRQREQSAALLRDLADQVPGMLYQYRLSADGRASFPYINQVGLEMHGIQAEQLPVGEAAVFAHLHPEDRERIHESILHSARGLQPWRQDYRLLIPDQGLVWRHGNSRPQKLKDGTILWHGYIADITERKRSEEALRQSEERLSRAELASKSGNWELHVDTQLMIASRGAARIYGVNEGHHAFSAVQKAPLPEYRPLLDSALGDLIEHNKPYDVLFKIRCGKTGEIKDVHSIATFDQEKRVVFGVIQDVTEQLSVQRALEQEESRRRIILEQSQDGIALLRRDGSLVEWNPAFAKMLGYSAEELGRINVKDWDINLGSDEIDRITYQLGLGHLDIETRHRRKDGTIYDVEVSINGVEWAGENYLFCLHSDITARKQAEMALQRSESRFRTIIEASPIPYALYDDQQHVTYLNASFINTFGYTLDDIPQLSDWWPKAYPDPEYRASIIETWQDHLNTAERERQPFVPVEAGICCKNGQTRSALVASEPLDESLGGLHVVSFFDITALKKSEEEQRLAATVFSHAREGILITDPEGTILDVNEMFSQLTGYSREEVVGNNPRVLNSGRHENTFYAAIWGELIKNGHWSGEIWNRRKNGEIYPELLTISAVRDPQGKTQHYVALFSDITDIKNHEKQLEHMAHYDVLTRLPNRALLADRLQQAMSQAARRKNAVAVCYIDLDGFKAVNDMYGHEVGDQLLIVLATMMKHALRESDTLARIGGDEFVAILLDQEVEEESSLITVERLIHTASQPIRLDGLVVQISASLGVTFFPQEGIVDADQLLRQADHAMYQAKLTGKNRYCVFGEGLDSATTL